MLVSEAVPSLLMSEAGLKSPQLFDGQAGTTNELEHIALGSPNTLRLVGDLGRDLCWNRQQSIDVSMQEIAGVHRKPRERDGHVDLADQRVTV